MSTAGGSGSHDRSTGHLSTNGGRFLHILTAGYATGESDKVANGKQNYLKLSIFQQEWKLCC